MENIKQSLSNVYMTLNRLDIKATPNNTKILASVYVEIENIIGYIQREVGDKNDEREGE